MAENKKGFVLYADQKFIFDDLTNEEAGLLIKHIFSYVNDENPELKDRFLDMAFKPIKLQLKRDLVKYEGVKERNSANARKRWDATASSGIPKVPNSTKNADKDNDIDKGNDTDKDKVIDKDINIIEIWFKDLENSSDLETICIRNKFDINQVRIVKIPEFKKIAELEYPNYIKFVSHFKNWVIKNPPKDLNAPLKMVY